MLTAQGDSRNSKIASKEEARGFSWSMILLGLVFVACAVLLYLYASRNTPQRQPPASKDINDIGRTPPESNTTNSQTTPSPVRPTLKMAPSRDKAAENKNQ